MGEFDKRIERAMRQNVLALDWCIQWAYEQKKSYPQVTGFVLVLKSLEESYSGGYEATIACIDKNRKAVTLDGETALAKVLKINNVDEKMLDFLNGNISAVYVFDGR